MAIFTLTEINIQIESYKKALLALSTSQSYKTSEKELVRAEIAHIKKTLIWLDSERTKLKFGKGPRAVRTRVRR